MPRKALEGLKGRAKFVHVLSIGNGVVGSLAELVECGETRSGMIYADPPWRYGNQGTRAATNDHYVTMSVAETVPSR